MNLIVYLFVIILLKCNRNASADQMLELAKKQGVSMNCHYVTTADGYILRLYHIPTPAQNQSSNNRTNALKPMLFMHGLQSSSLDFVFYPNSSAGHFFSQLGYEVFIGNARGNRFSRNHTTLDPNDGQFWKFSWHEFGVYDLVAIIDFILEQTNQTQLIYAGYSQGGTSLFVLLSEHPEYNDKIASVHLMAPAVFYTKTNPLVTLLLKNMNTIKRLLEQMEIYEVNNYNSVSAFMQFFGKLCTIPALRDVCRFMIGAVFGPYAPNNYYDRLLLDYSSINPCGSSYMQFIHYGQIFRTGRFQQFDHGYSENMKRYQSAIPPQYNLNHVQTRLHVIFGSNDNLVSSKATRMLIKKLTNCTMIVDEMNSFNHLDFVMGVRVYELNTIILRTIEKFT